MIRGLLASKLLPILAFGFVVLDAVASNSVDVGFPVATYPSAKRDDTVSDTYPGNKIIKDPYRGLEAIDCDTTKKFIAAENTVSRSYLDKGQYRADLAARYKELYPFKTIDAFFQVGKKYFSLQNDGSASQVQDVIYVHDSPTGSPRKLLDPNTLSKDGSVYIDYTMSTFSRDGMIFAYMLSGSCEGGGWSTIQFLHVEKGSIYKETLTRVRYSYITFNGDNNGIFYSGYLDYKGKLDDSDTTPLQYHKLYYHKLGTDQSQDIVVAEFPKMPDTTISGWVTGQGKYLIVTPTANTDPDSLNCFVYIADLAKINYQIKGKLDLIPIVTQDEGMYSIVGNYDTTFIFITDKGADNWKLISFDLTNVGKTWRDLVPEDKYKLEFASPANLKYLILCYTADVKSVLQVHDMRTGKLLKKLNMEIGTVDQTAFFSDTPYKDFYFTLQSFTTPATIYHCDLSKSFELDIFHETVLKNFDRKKWTTKQVFYKSKDGTLIPMFIVHRQDLQKNGGNPVLMANNGGAGCSAMPSFSANRAMFMSNLNGIYVLVNNRGGREYGEMWHNAGMLHNEQNGIDDLQAAAEYLIAQQYTSPKLITMYGLGHGGMMVGACINQRPDLLGVAVIDSGFFDMLRFDQWPLGDAWVPEIGSPHNATDFPFIVKFSPLHNIKIPKNADQQYPAIMLTTAVEDCIPPAHSLKFIATLQFEARRHSNQKNPFLITIDTMTADQSENLDDQAQLDKITAGYVDMYSFIIANTGIKFQPSCQ